MTHPDSLPGSEAWDMLAANAAFHVLGRPGGVSGSKRRQRNQRMRRFYSYRSFTCRAWA